VLCRIRREFADGEDEVFVSLRDPLLPVPIETERQLRHGKDGVLPETSRQRGRMAIGADATRIGKDGVIGRRFCG
jgi:hypothetical protein